MTVPWLPNRRELLKQGVWLGAATLAPALTARTVEAPSERIRVGVIGCGGQGRANLKAHLKNVVAVCDVDRDHVAEAVNDIEKGGGKAPQTFADYRKLLDLKEVDAVVISTPDHWHALPTIHACQAGKDVYIEKPLSLTVVEGRAMVNAARRHNRIVQTGSMQRSSREFRQACELVRNGRLGKLKVVKVGLPGVNFKGPIGPDTDPPAALDYDFWLGPAPQRPYNVKRVHYNFRFFWDYSGGQMTNWGAHHLDIVQWALGQDAAGPVSVEAFDRQDDPKKEYEVPNSYRLVYTYADGLQVICGQNLPGIAGGVTFEGEKGTLFVNRGKIEATPAELLKETFAEGDVRLYVSNSHHGNWLDCIRNRKAPICDVEIGHRSATVCHLGNIAVRTGRKVRWDPVKEVVIDEAEANRMLSRPYRAPWKLPLEG